MAGEYGGGRFPDQYMVKLSGYGTNILGNEFCERVCVSQRTDVGSLYRKEASLRWWNTQAPKSELYISDEVLIELSDQRYPRREAALAFVEGIPVIAVSPPMVALARVFVERWVMPKPVSGDALHVAMATVSEMEYLLTWNVQHLANPNKVVHLNAVCLEFGLVPPRILRPDDLLEVAYE